VQLSLTEALRYLKVSETTARRWIRDRGLPAHRADERLFVNAVELWEWALEHRIPVSADLLARARQSPETVAPVSVLLATGGIHYDVPGRDPGQVLLQVVERMPLPAFIDRQFLATALAAREAMGSTGIGHGIAIPHVRNPILLQVSDPTISLCFLQVPVDFGSIDDQPVHTLFAIISPTVPVHLRILAQLSFLLQDTALRELLVQRAPAERLLERMRTIEAEAPAR
jgi:nitrogen PTS system EIIA component